MKMEKYIRLSNGNLYSYNDRGITIFFENENRWKPSPLTYETILYSDRSDYEELDELDVISLYGKSVSDSAKECFNKIENIVFKKSR